MLQQPTRLLQLAAATSRADGLAQLDACLEHDNLDDAKAQASATAIVSELTATGKLKAFGNGRQIPKRLYTLADLRLNKVDTTALLAPKDETLDTLQAQLQVAYLAGVLAWAGLWGGDVQQVGAVLLVTLFVVAADQISNMGGVQALVIDTLGRILQPSYRKRVAHHEAGHFLVAYLTGVLPIAFTLSSLDAFQRYRALNIQAGCRFADANFSRQVAAGKLQAKSLERFACIALAGVCAEFLKFGKAEGGMSDINQLDRLLKALQFTQNKADGEIRWAVLNTVSMLRRHTDAHEKLAAAMDSAASIGACIALLEDELASSEDL